MVCEKKPFTPGKMVCSGACTFQNLTSKLADDQGKKRQGVVVVVGINFPEPSGEFDESRSR